jgi:hypothetical protein
MAKHRSSSYSSTAEKVLLQPWFLPQRVTYALHGMLPPAFWKKMRNFFDDYGCMICGTDTGYHSNGMCLRCHNKVRKRLIQSVKRHLGRDSKQRLDLELLRQGKLAKKLLKGFSHQAPSGRRRIGISRNNPVYEALCARPQ